MSRLLLPQLLLVATLLVVCILEATRCSTTPASPETVSVAGAPARTKPTSDGCGPSRYSLLGRCYKRRGAGTLCLSDSWCRSGRCRLGLCHRGTGDCRSDQPACGTGQECVSTADGWVCRAPTGALALGAACARDSECATGACNTETGSCDCPTDFTSCAGHCYRATKFQAELSDALNVCHAMGYILATPRSAEEDACLLSFNLTSDHLVYLGYMSIGDDQFIGDDGELMTYTNWAEADNFVGEDAVVLGSVLTQWIKVPTSGQYDALVVCQTA
ncbi:uncharacterized protein LOC122384004 isoform X2 [Amphibalanus amphitrite]|nr:uncharacterized protein LOC122384004 isoform X2 [Amphibalanus amphitrite]